MYYMLTLWGLLAALIAVAIYRAQRPELYAIVLFSSAAVISILVTPSHPSVTPRVVTALFVIDTLVLAALASIAIRFRRTWAIVASALQIISTLAHFARLIDPTMDVVTYAVMEGASGLPQLLLLAIAIIRHPKRRTP